MLHKSVTMNRRNNPRTTALNLDLEVTPAARRLIQASQDILADSGLRPENADKAAVMWHLYGLGGVALSAGTWNKDRTGRERRSSTTRSSHAATRVSKMVGPEYEEYAIDLFIAGVKAMLAIEQEAAEAKRRPVRGRSAGKTTVPVGPVETRTTIRPNAKSGT
jgi:hypothetical protein